MDGDPILEKAELLEALGAFEGGFRKRAEAVERWLAISVEAEVLGVPDAALLVAVKGDGGAGEIERAAGEVGDDLDGVGIGDVVRGAGSADGGDLDVRLAHELEHGGEGHEHDDFDSFSITLPGGLSRDELLARIGDAIRAHDVLRLKGFAALPGSDARLAIQAVGPRINAWFDRPWKPGEARRTGLVVIGESPLDRAAISARLMGDAPAAVAAE